MRSKMIINAVCLVACLLASVGTATAAEQHLVDSPVLMKILKTVDEAPTDEHLLDVTLRLLKGICECMTETLLVKQERTSHADTNAIPYAPWMDDGAAINTTWKELELYQKIYNNTCFNLRNELAVKVDVDQLERSKNENDTQSPFKTWNCGKQHEITTERIVKASTSMAPVLDDSLRSQLDTILFKTLIVTKDYHTYKLRRRNLFGRNIPVKRNKKKHSIIVIVTLHPPQIVSRNGKVTSENVGSLTEINGDKLNEIELNRTIYSKSAVDIDIFDTELNPTEKESDENNKNVVSKCVLLSIYKFLTESETNNHTKVFKLLRRKKSIKIYIEIMTLQGDSNYSGMCCDGDAITASCKQQYIAKHLGKDETQSNIQNKLKLKPMSKIEERSSDYKDTIAKIKNLLKLYDDELQKSTYYGKKVLVDNKLEGPKHSSHVGGDAHANVIDVFAKHNNVANHVTKSTNSDKVEYTTQIFSTTAPSTQGIYTFKGFYDDELWDNTIPQQSKPIGSTINLSNDNVLNEYQRPASTKSNVYFINIKKYPLKKQYILNNIKREHVSPKTRATRSTETQTDFTSKIETLSDSIVNTERRSTDQAHQTLNPYAVIPINYDLVSGKKNKTTVGKENTVYSKGDKGSKIASLEEGINLKGATKVETPEIINNYEADSETSNKKDANKNLNDKINTITSMTNNNNFISKLHDFEIETENDFMDSSEHKTTTEFFDSFVEDDKRSTQLPTINTQQKAVNYGSYYLLRTTETSRIKQNDFNERIYETTKISNQETSTKFNYNDTVHNSQEDRDSHEKYRHAIINSIIESIHPQQFNDYVNVVNPTTDKIISKDSLLSKNDDTSTHPTEIQMDSSSITPMKSSAEYVDYSSESGEKHMNKPFQIHSTYGKHEHPSPNLLKSLLPLDPFVTSNNFSKNEYFTRNYETLAEKATESSSKFSSHTENNDLSEKYQNRLTNSTRPSLSISLAQVLKSPVIKNMDAITKVVDNYLSTTEDVIDLTIISENNVDPNSKHYINDHTTATIPGIVENDKNNILSYVYGSREKINESENIENGADGTGLPLKNKGYVDIIDSPTFNTEYVNDKQIGRASESSSNDIIQKKLETIIPSPDTDETFINNKIVNREYSITTSDNGETISSNKNNDKEKLDASTETTDGTSITAEKPETATEIIGTTNDDEINGSKNDENINKDNSYDTTATTFANTDSMMQRTEPSPDLSIEDTEKNNLDEYFATTNKDTPEKVRDGNQLDYLEQTTGGETDNAFVNAPELPTPAPMSLKKVEPLAVDRESSQLLESSSEDFDQRLNDNTPAPTFPMNVQPLLKHITEKSTNYLASAIEDVMVISEDDVKASESYTSPSILSMNVKPLVYTNQKHLSELKVTTATASIAPINLKHPMMDEEKSKYATKKIRNTTEDTSGNKINASGTDAVLDIEPDETSETHKSTPILTSTHLQVTSIGKYIEDSVSASDQSMAEHEDSSVIKTILQDTESKTSIKTQDQDIIASGRTSTIHKTIPEYVDYSVESGEKPINKPYEIQFTYDDQKHSSVNVFESLIPTEPITLSDNFTKNDNLTTSHPNLEINKTDYSVKFSSHLKNIEKNIKLMKNVSGSSFYTPYTKTNKSQDFSKNLQANISLTTNNIAIKKSNASQLVSEFDVPYQNVEPVVTRREGKPIALSEYKLMVTNKLTGFLQDLETHTMASSLSTNAEYLRIDKEGQQNNKFVTAHDEIPVVNASVFLTNTVPLFTFTTDKLVNGSISAISMNVTSNTEDLVQVPTLHTENNIDTIHNIEMVSTLKQIQPNSNKDAVESDIHKLAETDTTRPIPIGKTSTTTFKGKESYSTQNYSEAAFLYTTTNNPNEATATSILTSTQTTIYLNDITTKKYRTRGKQTDETHTKALNSSIEKSFFKGQAITSTVKTDTVTEYSEANQNNSTIKSLESDMEETLFNEIEKEESAENDKRIKGNLNEKTFNQQTETTLRNTIDDFHTTSKLETETDNHASLGTILLNRDKSVSLDSQDDHSVETSTLPSLSDRMSSMEYTVTKMKLKKSLLKLQDDVVNEQFASRTSEMSKLVTDALNHSQITPTYALANINVNESDKTAYDIAVRNSEFRPGIQQFSFPDHVKNITNLIIEKTSSTLSTDNNETDKNVEIIPKTKRIKLKEIYISDDNVPKKLTTNDNAINVDNNGSIIKQNVEKNSDREPFMQNMPVNNSHSELSQKSHQKPQKFLLFIKSSQNTEIYPGTNFYSQGYNRTLLKQETITDTIALQLRSSSSTPSADKISKVYKVNTFRNDDLNKQDSRTNEELDSRENKSEYIKFKDQEGGELNALTTLISREITTSVNSELNESTTFIKEKEQAYPKDDIEHKSGIELNFQSKENKLEYTELKYQNGKMRNDEPTVVTDEKSSTTIENNLIKIETSIYPTTVNSNIHKIIKLYRATPNNNMEEVSGIKEKSDSKENNHISTLFPLIITGSTSAMEEENLSRMETWSFPQFIPENLKENEIITQRNKHITLKNNIEQSNKTKSDIGSYENKSQYANLHSQIDKTPMALFTSAAEDFKAEVNLELNKLTTVAQKNEQAALKYHFEQISKTKADVDAKLNKFEFTDVTDQYDKHYISFTNTTEEIAAVVTSEVNEITTFRKDVPELLKDYNEQNIGTKIELEAKQNKFQYTDSENAISETADDTSTSSAKENTASISIKQGKNLPELETAINIASETDVPDNYKFTPPLAVTEDIQNSLSTSTLEEIKLGVNYELNEFSSLSKEIEPAVEKDHIKQTSVNKTEFKTQENNSEYTELNAIDITKSINKNEEPMLENHANQDSATNAELKAKENMYSSKYTELYNQKSDKADMFTSIPKKNTDGVLAEIVNNLSKIENTPIVVPKGIYLPSNYNFTLPVAVTEDILYNLYTSTPEEIKKELYSEVNEIITLKNDDSEIKSKLEAKKKKSTKITKLKDQDNEVRNETSIFAAKEVTAGMLATATKYLPNIETRIDIKNDYYYDKFTLPLAVTEDIINTVSDLNQEDIKLEVNPEINVKNTWKNKTYPARPKDHTEQDKSELKLHDNEILNSMSTLPPEEIKSETEFEVNKTTTTANGNEQVTQQNQIEQDRDNNANLETKENKSQYTKFKNREDERSNAISTLIATNTLSKVVEVSHTTETILDVLSTKIYNLDELRTSDSTLPLVATENIITSKITEEVTDIKMTLGTEQINHGNVLHNSYVGNDKAVNDIKIFSKTKNVIQGDFTAVNRINPTLSTDVSEKERKISSFNVDFNYNNNKLFKNITEYQEQPIHERNVSNIKVNSHLLSDQNDQISIDTLNNNDINVVTPVEITEEVTTTINFGNKNNKPKEMSITGLHKTLSTLIVDNDNINVINTNFISMNESVSNKIESLKNKTAVNKKSVEELSVSTKSIPKEKNKESSINGEVNILSTDSITVKRDSFMRETVPQIISNELSFTFNNFVQVPSMVKKYEMGTVPDIMNIPSRDTEISTLPNLGEDIIKNVKDEKESFIMTLHKPLLENVKMTNHTIHEPRTYDFHEKLSLSGEDKHTITNNFFNTASTNIDFDDTMKEYKVSISALEQNIDNENSTTTTTTINQAEESVVSTESVELPEEQLVHNTDADDVETNNAIKKPQQITTVGMKYPTLIYSPVSYLDQRLFTENNHLASNHDNFLSDTSDSLQKKYSREADEVLSELAAVLNLNCNNTNKVTPSEMCYTNVLASIAQGNKNLPTDDPVTAKSGHMNLSKSGTITTPAAKNTSFVAQKAIPDVKNITSKGVSNLTHSDFPITKVDILKLPTYAKEAKRNRNSGQHDTNQTKRSKPLYSTVPAKISSLNSEYIKKDDTFKKPIIIASAFKNLDFLFKKSVEDTSLQKYTKSLNTESRPLKVQLPTTALADKALEESDKVATAAKNKYNLSHLNDSKIYYIPFTSNAAVKKKNPETSSNTTNYVANSVKQELSLANLNINNETNKTTNTSERLDLKKHKIQSKYFAFNSTNEPQTYKFNENVHDPTESTQVLSINKHKAFDLSEKKLNKKNYTISNTGSPEKDTSIETKRYNKIRKSLQTLDKTFNNSVSGPTYPILSSPPWKYRSMKNVNDVDFQEKRGLLNEISKSGEIINKNMFYSTHSDLVNKHSNYALFNATESVIQDSVDLKRDKSINMDEISSSTFKVSSTTVIMNKTTKSLTKDKEFDDYKTKNNISEHGFQNFNNTRIGNESTIGTYITPVVSHRATHQLFPKIELFKELNGAATSPAPKFSSVPDKVLIGSAYFSSSTKTPDKSETLINAETKEPYLIQTNVQDLWNSLQYMIDISADHDVNTIQVNQPVSNTDTADTTFNTGKPGLPAVKTGVNDRFKVPRQHSHKQTSEEFDKFITFKHLFTNDEILQKSSKQQITKGYVPIMTFTEPPKNALITKLIPNKIKKYKTYKPSSTLGFNLYTTKRNIQSVDTKHEKRNDKIFARNYIPYSKKYIRKSTPTGANIEGYIVSKLIHLVPEIVEKVTSNDSVPSKAPEEEKNMRKSKLNFKNMIQRKADIYYTSTNTYSTKPSDKEAVKSSTSKIVSSSVGNSKYKHSAIADDILEIFSQPTHLYPNIQPNLATESNAVGIISYSIRPNITVMRSTKKIKRHRNSNHSETDDTTMTAPQSTTVRMKRRRTSKRIVYNTYEPTLYEDLEMDFTDELGKKSTQVKPTRANDEEIHGELLKSSNHVHIGDATAILPWPVYFPTPSTTRQVNVRGKIELSHIVRQKNFDNEENALNRSMNSFENIDIKIIPRPTRLPVFNTFYRNHLDATEKMTSLPVTHIDSVPVFVSVIGPKPTRLVNFNHYEKVITTESTRLLDNKIHNNIETIPIQSKPLTFRNGPVRNAFTSTLLPPETPKLRKHNIHHSVMRKAGKNLSFYQGLGKIFEKPTRFPIFGDLYKHTANFTKNVKSPTVHNNLLKTATNENNIAEDKVTAFMKATHSSNMKILLFRKNDPRVSKINQFQTKKIIGDITYSPNVKRGLPTRFAIKQIQLGKKKKSKVSTGRKKSLRTKFMPSKLDVASTTDTNVDFTLKYPIISNVQKSTEIIKHVISKSQRIKGILLDPLDSRVKTKLYPVKVGPKYKVKKVHLNVDENNLFTVKPKELILNKINRKLDTARRNFFDELARNNMKTYIVHSAKPSLSRQILLRPKFESIDNAVRITKVPPIESIEEDARPNLIAMDGFENRRMPIAFNSVQNKNKQIRALPPNMRKNKFNVLEKPLYFPIMNREAIINSENKYRMSTRGFLVPEEKYFLESPIESFREVAIPMPPPAPSTQYPLHYVKPLKPRRSRRTIFFLSPTASYIEYF